MKLLKLAVCLYLMIFFSTSCSTSNLHKSHTFDKQAHRGGRGLMPENTIASEKNAIDYDCTMEMDLQMSKEKKLLFLMMHISAVIFVLRLKEIL